MLEIIQDTFLQCGFFMADSADYATGITGLAFDDADDIRLAKPDGTFVDITSACVTSETGFGWYWLTSSVAAHMDTLGENTLHITETDSATAWPAEKPLWVKADDVTSAQAQVSSLDAKVTSLDALCTSMSSTVHSYDQYKADLTQLLAGVAQGSIVLPTASVDSDTPVEVRKAANFNGIFYLPSTFSSFVGSEFPVWFTAKQRERDSDSDALWTVQGTVSNVQSMSAVFSLDPSSHTNQELTDFASFGVQFRTATGDVVMVAMTGGLKIVPTYKRGA